MEKYTYSSSNQNHFKIFNYTVPSKEGKSKKILVISDLHIFNSRDIKILNSLKSSLEKSQYDAIIIAGDIFDATNVLRSSDAITSEVINFISFLGSIAPTFIAYASHDLGFYYHAKNKDIYPWLSDEAKFYEKFLDKAAGMPHTYVEDKMVYNIGDNYTISIINPSMSYADFLPDGNQEQLLKESEKYAFLKNIPSNMTNTVVCHYPNVFFTLQSLGLLNKVDTCIAGHNHNGASQFKFIPVEFFFNLIGAKNRGLITPGKSLALADTKNLRGVVELNDRANLVINPAIKTFAACTGPLEKLDGLFYRGMTEINYVPESTFSLKRIKK